MGTYFCEECGEEVEHDDRWRLTIRGDKVQLQGRFDGTLDELREFAVLLTGYGVVAASPMDDHHGVST